MTEPLVCAICLVNGRPEMTRRAVESFRAQSYERKRLYVYDTGVTPCTDSLPDGFPDFNIVYHRGLNRGETIGALRNTANWWGIRPSSTSDPDADIICHWDSDDVSHPQRISEQVALLQSSGADAVGYREAAFYDQRVGQFCGAWIYRSHDTAYAIGASLAFHRKTWERVKFPNVNIAEDRQFCARVNCLGVSAIKEWYTHGPVSRVGADSAETVAPAGIGQDGPICEPRIICGIHGTNTADYSKFSTQVWRRAPELDAFCRERMAL